MFVGSSYADVHSIYILFEDSLAKRILSLQPASGKLHDGFLIIPLLQHENFIWFKINAQCPHQGFVGCPQQETYCGLSTVFTYLYFSFCTAKGHFSQKFDQFRSKISQNFQLAHKFFFINTGQHWASEGTRVIKFLHLRQQLTQLTFFIALSTLMVQLSVCVFEYRFFSSQIKH